MQSRRFSLCGNENCSRKILGDSIYCRCGFVEEDYENIAAENAAEEVKDPESAYILRYTSIKKRLTELEILQQSKMLAQSLNEFWYCTHCSQPSPMDYDYYCSCALKKSFCRSEKPLTRSLQETSKMDQISRFST